MKLLIVESPNKIKKLKSILGPEFDVAASVGHIRDLPVKELGIDRANGYKMHYEVYSEKAQVVSNLQFLTKKYGKENVLLATDPDREGEAIGYHLAAVLGIPYKEAKRVTFQEITDKAVKKALQEVRSLDLNLISAQEGRRAIDRLAGYEISSIVNRKVEHETGYLSAGRVQSVALRLVVERERAVINFKPELSYKLQGSFLTEKNDLIKANYVGRFDSAESALKYLEESKSKNFSVANIQKREVQRQPSAAFSTSTLQQVAIKKFKWSAKKVMEVAQKLFEQGHITYMRTDSPNLSDDAIQEIKKFVSETISPEYFQERKFKVSDSAQEAHEAIRPTHFDERECGENDDQKKLYELIYCRAIASQMKPALYDEVELTISSQIAQDDYTAKARTKTFAGFLAIYQEDEEDEDEDETEINPVNIGDPLKCKTIVAKGTFSTPPKRYDEATLVKDLEKRGIGRPSTYANILNNIINTRNYIQEGTFAPQQMPILVLTLKDQVAIEKTQEVQKVGGDKQKLAPTEIGVSITIFLEKHFSQIVDYTFTAEIEGILDLIAKGGRDFKSLMHAFDIPHQKHLAAASAIPDIASKTPKTTEIGQIQGHPVRIGAGDKGTYAIVNKEFYNLDKAKDDVTIEDVIQAMADKKEKSDKSLIHTVGKFSVKIGQYGMYVTDGKTMAPLKNTTEQEAKTLTADRLKEIVKDYADWKKKNNKGGKK